MKDYDTTTLAYIGDAVYELYIRRHVLGTGSCRADAMNKRAVRYVCADGQSLAAHSLMSGFLTEEETALLKRARNHTNTAKPRGTSPMCYKMATGLEALLGFLFIRGDKSRLNEIINECIRVVDGQNQK